MRFRFHPSAEAEHLEHVAFYEERQPGLADRYLKAFEEAMAQVCEAPHRYRIERPPSFRRYRLLKFPFCVLYREQGGEVEVLAVPHLRQRPSYWIRRI